MVTGDGSALRLKLRELGLLAALASERDRVLTREELIDRVWGRGELDTTTRAVDACVARVRAALAEALPDVRYIHTHARIGYRFAPEEVEAESAQDAADETEGSSSESTGSLAVSELAPRPRSASGELGTASNL